MAYLLKPDCGPVFRPLRDRKTFLSTMTVMNGTLAFDIAGGRTVLIVKTMILLKDHVLILYKHKSV